MLERPHSIVINTTPLIAIAVATGRLDVLQFLYRLTVTGSVGVMAKAKQLGYALDGEQAIQRLRAHGIWLGRDVMRLLQSECQP
ncbi:DUF3368 domain-containing protein [Thiorhodovibrio frisius]|uniref:DUF3368 domain-containing protein n=1 Tax=Thiorhodovibrio frisius TaxID=631362 RepID=H8YVW2_9GAMM|nr:DUF3368 domain-containing protein [Thiorhodovibrio frisius]EIC23753.1 protein of unknown function (DUF3368) [Thiorhodovibrio frisius]WPL20162.1 hypothetical protein Thiofri_00226 [Thiorhodovibrio frisius]